MTKPLPTTREGLEAWLRGKVIRKVGLDVAGVISLHVSPHKMSGQRWNVELTQDGKRDAVFQIFDVSAEHKRRKK